MKADRFLDYLDGTSTKTKEGIAEMLIMDFGGTVLVYDCCRPDIDTRVVHKTFEQSELEPFMKFLRRMN